METLNSFLPELIKQLPAWLINLCVIVLICLFAILSLSPKMISGTLTCKTFEGERCPKLSIKVNFGGRDIRTAVIEGTGTFYVPMYSPMTSQQVSFYLIKNNVEVRMNSTMIFDLYSVWAEKQFNIDFVEVSPGNFEKRSEERFGGNFLAVIGNMISSLPEMINTSANAAELMTYHQLMKSMAQPRDSLSGDDRPPADIISREQANEISLNVRDAIAKVASESLPAKDPNESLLRYSVADMEKISQILKQEMNISIPARHWQYLATEEDTIDYVKSLKGLEIRYPEIFVNHAEDWSSIEQDFQARTGEPLVLVPKF